MIDRKPLRSLLLLLTIIISAGLLVSPVKGIGSLFVDPSTHATVAPGSTVTYSVKVSNIDPFSGWDVSVKVDPSFIKPSSVSVAGNLLTTFGLTVICGASGGTGCQLIDLVNCVNGGFNPDGTPIGAGLPGNIGCTSTDGSGIAHSVLSALSLPPMSTTSSGLLFTVTYVSTQDVSPTCSISTSNCGTFVTPFNDLIQNGTPLVVAHSTTGATYGTPSTATFTITSSPTSQSVTQGSAITYGLTVTSSLFTGMVSLVPAAAPPLSATLMISPTPVSLPTSGSSATATLSVTTTTSTAPGTYTITVTGTGGSASSSGVLILVVTAATAPDFAIDVNPVFMAPILASQSGLTTVNVTSLNGFSQPVLVNATIGPGKIFGVKAPPTATFTNPTFCPTLAPTCTVTPPANGFVLVTMNITTYSNTAPSGSPSMPSPKGLYTALAIGSTTTVSHNGVAFVRVLPPVGKSIASVFFKWIHHLDFAKTVGVEEFVADVQNNATNNCFPSPCAFLFVRVVVSAGGKLGFTNRSPILEIPAAAVAGLSGPIVRFTWTFDMRTICAARLKPLTCIVFHGFELKVRVQYSDAAKLDSSGTPVSLISPITTPVLRTGDIFVSP